jgi:hypothetical protein
VDLGRQILRESSRTGENGNGINNRDAGTTNRTESTTYMSQQRTKPDQQQICGNNQQTCRNNQQTCRNNEQNRCLRRICVLSAGAVFVTSVVPSFPPTTIASCDPPGDFVAFVFCLMAQFS